MEWAFMSTTANKEASGVTIVSSYISAVSVLWLQDLEQAWESQSDIPAWHVSRTGCAGLLGGEARGGAAHGAAAVCGLS